MKEEDNLLGKIGDNIESILIKPEKISMEKHSDSIVYDAAALCNFVYARNPHRKGQQTVYHTTNKDWYILDKNGNESNVSALRKDISNHKSNLGNHGLLGGTLLRWHPYNVFDRLNNKMTGFSSMVFYRCTGKDITDIAYVTEGTSGGQNWSDKVGNSLDLFGDIVLADITQAILGMSPQYTRSIQNAKALYETSQKNPGCKMWFFGHSLGGGLAVANAHACPNAKAITFNQAGLGHVRKFMQIFKPLHNDGDKANLLDKIKRHLQSYRIGNGNITSYYTHRDMLSHEQLTNWNLLKILKLLLTMPDGKRIYLNNTKHGLQAIVDYLKPHNEKITDIKLNENI